VTSADQHRVVNRGPNCIRRLQKFGQTLTAKFIDVLYLLVVDTSDLRDFCLFQLLGFLSAFLATEGLGLDNNAMHAGGSLQAGITNITGLLAKNGAQQPLFRRKLGLTLRRDLTNHDVASLNLSALADNPALIQIEQGLLRDIRNLARHFFGAALGIAHLKLEFLDVNRGENIIPDQAL